MLCVKEGAAEQVLSLLPVGIGEEIRRLAYGRRGGLGRIREIRIRSGGACTLTLGEEEIRLYARPDRDEMDSLCQRILGGALYAHRDSIASGYISLGNGIRVGVCGSAAYEGGRLVGVRDLCSLAFRIPSGECEFADELYGVYLRGIGQGMLIYSLPGVGKTTALRSLAALVGGGDRPIRVCVVDERSEFVREDYYGCEVDILSGYRRPVGIEIATRTMSAQLIMIDELSAEDGESLLGVLRCGIPIVATAHAADFDDIMRRPALRPLIDLGVFSVYVGITRGESGYRLQVDRV